MADAAKKEEDEKSKEKTKEREYVQPAMLKRGQIVRTPRNAFKIEKTIGASYCGYTYRVSVLDKESEKYALKTECVKKNKKREFLMNECVVLEAIKKAQNVPNKHAVFAALFDKGVAAAFAFIVTEFVGYDMGDIFTIMLNRTMPRNSAIFLMEATYDAIYALHKVGFVHGDVKPAQFSIGRGLGGERRIILREFGLSRRFRDEVNNKIIPPRPSAPFEGTVNYCSRATHENKDKMMRDDLEGWLYMCLMFFDTSNLPWLGTQGKAKRIAGKKELFNNLEAQKLKAPQAFLKCFGEINHMEPIQVADEEFFRRVFIEVKEQENYDPNQPVAWEGKTMPKRGGAKKEEKKEGATKEAKKEEKKEGEAKGKEKEKEEKEEKKEVKEEKKEKEEKRDKKKDKEEKKEKEKDKDDDREESPVKKPKTPKKEKKERKNKKEKKSRDEKKKRQRKVDKALISLVRQLEEDLEQESSDDDEDEPTVAKPPKKRKSKSEAKTDEETTKPGKAHKPTLKEAEELLEMLEKSEARKKKAAEARRKKKTKKQEESSPAAKSPNDETGGAFTGGEEVTGAEPRPGGRRPRLSDCDENSKMAD